MILTVIAAAFLEEPLSAKVRKHAVDALLQSDGLQAKPISQPPKRIAPQPLIGRGARRMQGCKG
jgi:hypothetical protein